MNLAVLTDDELFKLAAHQFAYNEYIHEEWLKRYKLFFPYRLKDYQIYNCILGTYIKESQCDKLVLKQAEVIRQTCYYE